ncbi:MAG: DUF983 domain-containing protein [Pseudomonadota bacterium]
MSTQEPETDTSRPEVKTDKRPLGQSLWLGWRRRCPRCGEGEMMRGYLQVADRCPVCRMDLSHHRADDGPAWLTMLIVGHIMAPALHWGFVTFRPEPLVLISVFLVGCVSLALFLLPRLKGMIVSFQWAKSMGGFNQPDCG